jgi:DNA-binding MarR family transcriptional regulator
MVNISEAIQQSSFQSPMHEMIINILYTASFLTARHERTLKPFGISHAQYNVLRILRGAKSAPMTVQLIQDRMIDRMSNASRLVEKLRTKGFLDRRICEHDRRAVDILITEDGLNLLKKIDGLFLTEESLLRQFPTAEAERISRALDLLRDKLGSSLAALDASQN